MSTYQHLHRPIPLNLYIIAADPGAIGLVLPLYISIYIYLSLSLLLCLPTYDPFPTLTSHSLSPSSLSLSFISATCIPIPIYLFLIAVDPRAGIGLVNYELSSVKREEHKSPINQEANTTELLKSYHVCCVSIVMHVLEDRDQL